MSRSNSFTISGRLPSLNDYINACRTKWAAGAEFKRTTEDAIIWAIRSAKNRGDCRPVKGPCIVEFIWYEHGKQRDLDNIYSAKKYILDAMQKAGIIENDDRNHVIGLCDEIRETGKGCDRVHVVIWEADK